MEVVKYLTFIVNTIMQLTLLLFTSGNLLHKTNFDLQSQVVESHSFGVNLDWR